MREVSYPTPGEILDEEFLKPLGLSRYRLARAVGVSQRRIDEIVHGKRAVTIETSLRLAKFFGTSPAFWIGLQIDHDIAMKDETLVAAIDEIKPLNAGAAA